MSIFVHCLGRIPAERHHNLSLIRSGCRQRIVGYVSILLMENVHISLIKIFSEFVNAFVRYQEYRKDAGSNQRHKKDKRFHITLGKPEDMSRLPAPLPPKVVTAYHE